MILVVTKGGIVLLFCTLVVFGLLQSRLGLIKKYGINCSGAHRVLSSICLVSCLGDSLMLCQFEWSRCPSLRRDLIISIIRSPLHPTTGSTCHGPGLWRIHPPSREIRQIESIPHRDGTPYDNRRIDDLEAEIRRHHPEPSIGKFSLKLAGNRLLLDITGFCIDLTKKRGKSRVSRKVTGTHRDRYHPSGRKQMPNAGQI